MTSGARHANMERESSQASSKMRRINHSLEVSKKPPRHLTVGNILKSSLFAITSSANTLLISISIILISCAAQQDGPAAKQFQASAQSISIRPADFDRLIMPCYLGTGGYAQSGYQSSYAGYSNQPAVPVSVSLQAGNYETSRAGQQSLNGAGQAAMFGGAPMGASGGGGSGGANRQPPASFYDQANGANGRLGSNAPLSQPVYPAPPPAYGPLPARAPSEGLVAGASSFSGQSIPRASTIDNFIALVSKIESANPRLAQNVDELIRALLSRFRLDNYYYDARSRTPISADSSDRRQRDFVPAILGASALNGGGGGTQTASASYDAFQSAGPAYSVADQALEPEERCSMYFMLSHFIDKTSAMATLGQLPVAQLSGPLQGQRAPNLQVQATPSGSSYPAQSALSAYSGGQAGARFSGPSPSFGSPATNMMSSFGAGLSNSQADYTGKNAYGVNSPLASGPLGQTAYSNNALLAAARNAGGPTGSLNLASNRAALGAPPYIDGQARARAPDDRVATEYGVVTLAGQENAALVLNRVLLGILAANSAPQVIRQIAAAVYPNQAALNLNTPKADEELDPLFAVTLADLWAVSSIPKSGRPFDLRLMGDNGRWNDSFCPTTFTLERANSIKFTTAELLGGMDGFNLGILRRKLNEMRRNVKLSELLKIYYSPLGFRPQFPEVGVCNRYSVLSTQLDDLHRQAENYARLIQLDLPTNDNEISRSISRLDMFREMLRQAASQYAPQSICGQESGSSMQLYPMGGQESCEISRADVVAVLDSAAQANQDPYMQLTVAKIAQRLGLAARGGSSLSIMTNQLDTTGTAGGGYSLNTIVRNSTNLAEIGCALTHDSTRTYQGGQVTDAARLMELFERALVSLDSEYLTRQVATGGNSMSTLSSSARSQTFVSTWQMGMEGGYSPFGATLGGPRNTGGAKVILWFNYASSVPRPNSAASGPTNWTPGQTFMSSGRNEDNEYRFYEAKKFLRENFRGASILAISPNRDAVKAFVYDEERDILTDIPQASSLGNSAEGSLANDYPPPPSSSSLTSGYGMSDSSAYSGQAEQLVGKLMQRMCTIPALFQYPMCFRGPSEGAQSVGYITPGRKQYWMMAPKTFFASRSIRIAFRVEGGRLRVCFGRRPNPDETASKNRDQQQLQGQQMSLYSQQQQQQQQQGSIGFGDGNGQRQTTQTPQPRASSDDYYTGLEYGVCKDVAPGGEIDFMIADACYKKSIAECEPFYFVVRETSQPGEGDPMYMCRDDGCKRFDQVKFVMTHSGVVCSSAWRPSISWLTIMISTLMTSYALLNARTEGLGSSDKFQTKSSSQQHQQQQQQQRKPRRPRALTCCSTSPVGHALISAIIFTASYLIACVQQVNGQLQAGVYDFGQGRYGEKRGNFTPSEWVAIVLIVMLILGGLAITIALCYYVTKRTRQGMTPVAQSDY